ncbi:MAG: GspE/PulE family protein [Candidatus Saccharimonadales bacterium]
MALSEQLYRKIFVEEKKILNDYEFGRVIREAGDSNRPLNQVLIEHAYLSPSQFLQLLADHFQVPPSDLKVGTIDTEILVKIPEEFANNNLAVAFGEEGDAIKVALEDPSKKDIIEQIGEMLQRRVAPYVASEYAIRRALVLYTGDLTKKIRDVVTKIESHPPADEKIAEETTELLTAVIETAVLLDTSDIHIEPYESEFIIRFRIDGQLHTSATVPKRMEPSMLARLKVISELKVDQTRLPQDGRFTQVIKGQEVNFRISTIPTLWGEKAVLRVLPREAHLFDLHNLGLLDSDLRLIESYLKRPHGMILVTGPTGSGKTTTLYACLQEIGNDRIDLVNINTIEDPVEYTMPRINQIQTQAEIDLTFASGLRALLRQDPDIIMVGEIRDEETADFAIRSALVGRLVLSSVHTNDSTSTIIRLLDMGIEPYLISSTLVLVITQRLARRLCPYCRTPYTPDDKVIAELIHNHDLEANLAALKAANIIDDSYLNNLQFYDAKGCKRCNGQGYSGRIGVYEILPISENLQSAINNRVDNNKIRNIALDEGMKTMFNDGMVKVLKGEIDLQELLRVAYS